MPVEIEELKNIASYLDTQALTAESVTLEASEAAIIAKLISEIINEYQYLKKITTPLPADYGDISSLPSELIEQLSAARAEPYERELFAIVRTAGQDIDLDRILIEIYRTTKRIDPRKLVMSRLYKMAQKGIIEAVAGKKGVYRLPKGGGIDEQAEEVL